MSEEQFNNWLPIILILMAILSLLSALNAALFLTIVDRWWSKVLCVFSVIVFLGMTFVRVTTSYNPSDYSVRFLNAWILIFGQAVGVIVFFWSFLIQRRERRLRSQAEQKVIEASLPGFASKALLSINPDKVFEWIHRLHPEDAHVLARKYSNYK